MFLPIFREFLFWLIGFIFFFCEKLLNNELSKNENPVRFTWLIVIEELEDVCVRTGNISVGVKY